MKLTYKKLFITNKDIYHTIVRGKPEELIKCTTWLKQNIEESEFIMNNIKIQQHIDNLCPEFSNINIRFVNEEDAMAFIIAFSS